MQDGRLCFEGVDSSFNIPVDPKTIESFFDTDGNYSSLKLKVAYGAGYTFTIRQKWNWNEGYRLGDLREEMLKQLTEADGETGIAVLPPESNSGTWDPWFTASGYAMVGLGVATFSAAWIRATLDLEMPLGTRATWVIASLILALGIASAVLKRYNKRSFPTTHSQ